MAFNVKGKTIKDLIDLDIDTINRMTRSDLSKVVSRLVSASNKRIRRAKASGVDELSPAYIKDRKMFSVKGKNVGQLKNEYKKIKNFLTLETSSQRKTSTSKGFRQVQKKVETRIGKFKSDNQEKKFWKAYRKLEEKSGGGTALKHLYGSTEVQQALYKNINENDGRRSVDSIIESMDDKLNELYENKTNQYSLTDEDDDFYDVDEFNYYE